jgi:hypothetical protein
VAGSCECGNEPSGSVKRGVFLDSDDVRLLTAQEGHCFKELVMTKT